jgi:hypothetical protein
LDVQESLEMINFLVAGNKNRKDPRIVCIFGLQLFPSKFQSSFIQGLWALNHARQSFQSHQLSSD